MLHPPVTVSIAFVHGMLTGVRSRGRECASFLADAGIAAELLDQPDARVTTDQYVSLLKRLTEQLNDDFLGLLSRPLRRGCFALIARSAIGAETLEVAMRRIALTFGLLQDDLTLDVISDGKLTGLALRFVEQDIARPNFLHELLLRVFWRMLAWLAGGTLPAARFDFAFECPSYAKSYARIFPSSLQFEQPRTAFWFETSRLQRSVRRDEVALQAFIADMQTILIVPRGTDEVIARVRSHLHKAQPAWPDLTETARALAMSGSTLQRRLAVEGTSFQSVKDELRRDLAIVRLNTSAVPLAALADELGFANSAAFQRAFKSWTGSPPGSYRRSGPA